MVAFAGVRALVVLPEFAVVGGAAGVGSEFVSLEGCSGLAFDSLVRALVMLPEFAAAAGELFAAPAESLEFSALVRFGFDFRVDVDVPLFSPAAPVVAGVSPVGGVALAAGSAAALFFVSLLASGVVPVPPAVVCPASAFFVFDLLREVVPDAPAALVVLSVPVLLAFVVESVFFLLDFVFFEVVAVSPEAAVGAAVVSAVSAAGFLFFVDLLFGLVALSVWSLACAACALSAAGFFFFDLLPMPELVPESVAESLCRRLSR